MTDPPLGSASASAAPPSQPAHLPLVQTAADSAVPVTMARRRPGDVVRQAARHNRALEAVLLFSQGAGVLASVVVARSVGPPGRGTVVTLTTWGQILGWLAAMSLDKAVVVLSSGPQQVTGADDALRAARVPALLTSLLAAGASIPLGHRLFGDWRLTTALAATTAATCQAELVAGWLLAKGREQAYLVWRLAQPTLYVLLMVGVALALWASPAGRRTVAFGVAAGASVALPVLPALVVLPRRPYMRVGGLGALARFGAATQVGNVLQYLNGRLDILTLTFVVAAPEVGYYSAGVAVGEVTLLMATAGVVRGITGKADRTDRAGVVIAGALALVVFVAAPLAVPLVFGPSFRPAVSIARILALGGVVNYALQGACGRLLGARRPWAVAAAHGAGAVVFAAGIIAFPTVHGAAWSSVVSFTASLVVAEAWLRRS